MISPLYEGLGSSARTIKLDESRDCKNAIYLHINAICKVQMTFFTPFMKFYAVIHLNYSKGKYMNMSRVGYYEPFLIFHDNFF